MNQQPGDGAAVHVLRDNVLLLWAIWLPLMLVRLDVLPRFVPLTALLRWPSWVS